MNRNQLSASACLGGVALVLLIGCQTTTGLDPSQFTSSTSLQSLDPVQKAVATLAANGQANTFFSGAAPINLQGTWNITSSTLTFTDTGSNNSTLPAGRMTFAAASGSSGLAWTISQGATSGASLKTFIDGTSNGVTASIFSQISLLNSSTGTATCSSQNAVFLSFRPGATSNTLTGTFLSVVLASLSGSSSCSAVGSFAFGTMNLQRINPDIPVIELLGVVPLGISTPTSVVVAPSGGFGYVTFGTGGIIKFDTVARTATFLPLPTPNTFTSVGPAGISLGGGEVGFAMQGDNRLLSYNTTAATVLDGQFLPPNMPSPATFLPVAPLYNSVSSVGVAALAFQNHRPALAVFDPHAGFTGSLKNVVSFGQDGLGLIRLSGDNNQVAAILAGGAPAGQAHFVGFVNVNSTTPTLTKEVDVSSASLGLFRDDQLIYSADGARVFIAKSGQIVAVATSSSFGVTTNDPRQDLGDTIRHLAVTSDNNVLAVTIAVGGNRANFVLLDPTTFNVLNRSTEPGAAVGLSGGSLSIMPGTRIAVVEDGKGNITPISTLLPFAAGQPLRAAASTATADIAATAVGGRTIAVVNRAERNLYLFALTNP